MVNTNFSSDGVSSRFRGEILRQVYRVWLWRRFAPVVIIEVAALALLWYQVGKAVFVQQVFENALGVFFAKPSGVFSFVVAAFLNASVTTKIIAGMIALFAALLVRHLTQGLLRYILVKERFFDRVRQLDKGIVLDEK